VLITKFVKLTDHNYFEQSTGWYNTSTAVCAKNDLVWTS